jgi:cold shock CspA family protein
MSPASSRAIILLPCSSRREHAAVRRPSTVARCHASVTLVACLSAFSARAYCSAALLPQPTNATLAAVTTTRALARTPARLSAALAAGVPDNARTAVGQLSGSDLGVSVGAVDAAVVQAASVVSLRLLCLLDNARPVPRGTVRQWSDDLGWGVIVSPEVPGEIWVHQMAIEGTGYRSLKAGEAVEFEYIELSRFGADQDGYLYRAESVRCE